MKYLILIVSMLLLLGMFGGAAAQEPTETPEPNPLATVYNIVGESAAEEGDYEGILTITPVQTVEGKYSLSWTINSGEIYAGFGIQRGNMLAALYPIGGSLSRCSINHYEVREDGTMEGVWGSSSPGGMVTEILTPLQADEETLVGTYEGRQLELAESDTGSLKLSLVKGQTAVYNALWLLDEREIQGLGMRVANSVAIAWQPVMTGQPGPSDTLTCGLIVYQIKEDSSLSGFWFLPGMEGLLRENGTPASGTRPSASAR